MIANYLFGKRAKLSYLLVAAILILFAFLGMRDIWTQEHRWADIVAGMFYRQDFLHPYLNETRYYDKPLLSYWLIALSAKIVSGLTTFALRLPSALAGLLAVFSIYQLGTKLKNREFGLLNGWMLLTTFYFIFWARTSSADMLNLAGTFFAISWYFTSREKPSLLSYTGFFIILSLTALCKGLVGAVVPLLAVMVDIVLQKSIRKHLTWRLFVAIIPAAIIYMLPFWASNHFGGANYGQSGLDLVYRENILRFLKPFDHQGPIYTYFIYLPIYLLPWTLLFIPALIALPKRYRAFNLNQKWIAWSLLIIFLFFTASGSRRSYYVLPIVPFAVLFTADWIFAVAKRIKWAAWFTVATYSLLFLAFCVLQPWYYACRGVERFANALTATVSQQKPMKDWQFVMLDAESKVRFYLELPPTVKNFTIAGGSRNQQSTESLLVVFPVLKNKPANTIFVTRMDYLDKLIPLFPGYRIVTADKCSSFLFMNGKIKNDPVAFVPQSK